MDWKAKIWIFLALTKQSVNKNLLYVTATRNTKFTANQISQLAVQDPVFDMVIK